MADPNWALRLRDQIGMPVQADGTVRFAADVPGLKLPGRVHECLGYSERSILGDITLAAPVSLIWVMCRTFWDACRELVDYSDGVASGLVQLGGCMALYDAVCANARILSVLDCREDIAVQILAALIDAGAALRARTPVFAGYDTHHDVPTSVDDMLDPAASAREIFGIVRDCALDNNYGGEGGRPNPRFRRDCEKILRWLPHVPEKILAVVQKIVGNDGGCDLPCCAILLELAAYPPPTPAELLPAKACYESVDDPDWFDDTPEIRQWLSRAWDWGRRMAWIGAVIRAGKIEADR